MTIFFIMQNKIHLMETRSVLHYSDAEISIQTLIQSYFYFSKLTLESLIFSDTIAVTIYRYPHSEKVAICLEMLLRIYHSANTIFYHQLVEYLVFPHSSYHV